MKYATLSDQDKLVWRLVGYGVPNSLIARLVGMTPRAVRKARARMGLRSSKHAPGRVAYPQIPVGTEQ